MAADFEPPAYPYERLDSAGQKAASHPGGAVDLSVGTPSDPPPRAALDALCTPGPERGYPASAGSPRFKEAAAAWVERRFGVVLGTEHLAACVGAKEMVATTPQYLALRRRERDTVLFPSVSYPTYLMGALLGGCRAVAVRVTDDWRLDLASVSEEDAARALALWVNSPGNPAGQLEDLGEAARWGRERGVPVLSDECYTELTWKGPARSILEHGAEGVLAVHSVSKRSNLAGIRAGFYAGDPELVSYLSEVRRHAGMMVPGPSQAAAAAALDDDEHVARQRRLYAERIELFCKVLARAGVHAQPPEGGLYLWARVPGAGDDPDSSWSFMHWLAERAGALVSPGDLYGEAGRGYVRAAMVQPVERLRLVASRMGLE
jgi:succinyldiaminopimelate transaminase